MNSLTEPPTDRLGELHSMEAQIARSLAVLSGSVMNLRLRKLLSERALRARNRRDQVVDLLARHGESSGTVECMAMRDILSRGSRLLAGVGNPFQRDVMMTGHCLRMEDFATAAYGSNSRLANRAGLTAEASQFAGFLSELEISRTRLQSLESELSRSAAYQLSARDLARATSETRDAGIPMKSKPNPTK